MSESLINRLSSSADSEIEKRTEQEKALARRYEEKEAAETPVLERIRTFQGYCGRILYEEAKKGNVTANLRHPDSSYWSGRSNNRAEYDRKPILYKASENFYGREFNHERTTEPFTADTDDDDFTVSIHIHRFRRILPTSGLPDPLSALYLVEVIGQKDDIETRHCLDTAYYADRDNKGDIKSLTYKFGRETISGWPNPEEYQEFSDELDEINSLLEPIASSYAVA